MFIDIIQEESLVETVHRSLFFIGNDTRNVVRLYLLSFLNLSSHTLLLLLLCVMYIHIRAEEEEEEEEERAVESRLSSSSSSFVCFDWLILHSFVRFKHIIINNNNTSSIYSNEQTNELITAIKIYLSQCSGCKPYESFLILAVILSNATSTRRPSLLITCMVSLSLSYLKLLHSLFARLSLSSLFVRTFFAVLFFWFFFISWSAWSSSCVAGSHITAAAAGTKQRPIQPATTDNKEWKKKNRQRHRH